MSIEYHPAVEGELREIERYYEVHARLPAEASAQAGVERSRVEGRGG